jgi:hypothetical protein
MIRAGTERYGEHSGYEGGPKALGEAAISTTEAVKGPPAPAKPAGILEWAAEHPFLVAAAAIGAAWYATRGRADEDEDGDEVRSNPAPVSSVPAAPVIVMAPLAPGMQAPAAASTEASAPVPESKKARRRRTSQARDAQGHYLPAGTRKKAVTEGE